MDDHGVVPCGHHHDPHLGQEQVDIHLHKLVSLDAVDLEIPLEVATVWGVGQATVCNVNLGDWLVGG